MRNLTDIAEKNRGSPAVTVHNAFSVDGLLTLRGWSVFVSGTNKGREIKVNYVIGSMLSTDGTNSLLMNSPVWTGIFEFEFGMDSSTTCAMMIRVGCRR